jgi:hypothetical protein
MIRLLTVVVSCRKNEYIWKKILDRGVEDLVILCGGAEETKKEGQMLYLNCIDTYDGLAEKMMSAFIYILQSEQYATVTHILKADDHDTEFTSTQLHELKKAHEHILLSHDYIGQFIFKDAQCNQNYHFNKVPITSKWHNKIMPMREKISFCHGGRTYILSRKSLLHIIKHNEEYDNFGSYEDHMMAYILQKYGITPYLLDYGIKCWD